MRPPANWPRLSTLLPYLPYLLRSDHLTTKQQPMWVLPAEIPFANLKAGDLEECVYWLLDAMGARDLEWRTGSAGAGAADGGRDLEATFYQSSPDGNMEPQRWWVECKGRSKTVERDAVQAAVVNAQARQGLAYIVIVTNSAFSNPTRDWVSDWQISHPMPKVKLWDRSTLERLCSEQPSVVLRLFSKALSVEGQLQAARERFWQKVEYVQVKALEEFWAQREKLEIGPFERIALIANELANGSLIERPWGAHANSEELHDALQFVLLNLPYLLARLIHAGADQEAIIGMAAHLVMRSLQECSANSIATLMHLCASPKGKLLSEDVLDVLWQPILNQIWAELQDVCTADCDRFHANSRQVLVAGRDPVDTYWLRFDNKGAPPDKGDERWVRLENTRAACKVGFQIETGCSCPLFEIDPQISNLTSTLDTVERIIDFRVRT